MSPTPAQPSAQPPAQPSGLAVWIRAEVRPTERRTPLVPDDVAQLVAAGVHVTVERAERRIVPDAQFAAAGAHLADSGSWVDAPAETIILGLKELPPEPAQLRHRHVFFGHAYKGQPGAQELLDRFVAGGGELLDLEYVCDDDGRRLVAYGWWAGYIGAALAVLAHRGRLGAPLEPMARADLDAAIATRPGDTPARALVLGALGRSGRGAMTALETAGVPATAWDIAETRQFDRTALLAHDIVVNCVLSTTEGEPFLAPEHLPTPGRRLSLLSDVTCDIGSPYNRFPLYDDTTTWAEPVLRLADPGADGQVAFDVIVIDNLPSLLPLEASTSFSAALALIVAELATASGGWRSSRAAFRSAVPDRAVPGQALSDLQEEHHV